MNELLNGSNPTADQRLMEAVDAADPFDGGCPADCEPRPAQPATAYAEKIRQLEAKDRSIGLHYGIIWLYENGHRAAADAIDSAHSRGEVLK